MKYSQIVNIESNDNYKSEDLIHKKFIELISDSIYMLGSVGSFPCSIYKIYTVYLYTCVAHQDAALSTYLESKILPLSLSHYLCFVFILLTYMLKHDKHNWSFSYRNLAKFTVIFLKKMETCLLIQR